MAKQKKTSSQEPVESGKTRYHYPLMPGVLKPQLERMKMSQAIFAEHCDISVGAFNEIVNGWRMPDPSQMEKIVKHLKPPDENGLRAQIKAALAVGTPRYDNVVDRLRHGGLLKLTTIDYKPFCGQDGCFFEEVFFPFFALAGIRPAEPVENRRLITKDQYRDHDVHLGLFDSADRMLNQSLKFWRVPIRMGLGAVCMKKHSEHADTIALILSGLEEKDSAGISIRPIVVENDIGHVHCEKRLGFGAKALLKSDPEPRKLSLALRRGAKALEIPVVVTDEYTAFEVAALLKDESFLVFPMNSRRAGQDRKGRTRQQLPQYYSSIAVDGNDRTFRAFMHDALAQFLSTEIETTANHWNTLAVELAEQVANIPQELLSPERHDSQEPQAIRNARRSMLAWEWVFYTLNLDNHSIDSYADFNYLPWKPILRRARELFQTYLASQQEQLANLVELLWNSNERKDRLCALLDVHLNPEFRNLPKTYILAALQSELRGVRAPAITAGHYDPKSESAAALAMRMFMRRLQNVYDERGHDDAVEAMRSDIDGLKSGQTLYAGESGCVVLAQHHGHRNTFIGGACLRKDTKSNKCELRYLWADPQFRGHNVGKTVLEKAIDVAGSVLNCDGIYVEVIESLFVTARDLFLEMNFVKSGVTPAGRTVFQRSLVLAASA